MLLILLYHRAGIGPYSNPVPVLREHFDHLRRCGHMVLPGEPLQPRRLNVCLTFDDAYADFHAHVFPLLQEFGLRALLAVPTAFVIDRTTLPLQERLSPPQDQAMQGDLFRTKAPFCTWDELRSMTASGCVQVASHSHSHLDLTRPDVDLPFELLQSRKLIEEHLGRPVSSLVYPFGKVNGRAHALARQHYTYTLRIGSAFNTTWSPPRQPLCRVLADRTPAITRLLSTPRLALCGLKWAANHVRAACGKWEPDRANSLPTPAAVW